MARFPQKKTFQKNVPIALNKLWSTSHGLKGEAVTISFKGINFENSMIFDSRETAGRLLGEWLKEKLGKEGNYIVLGIPRGGVVVAKETAEILGVPLGVLIVRKLGVPENPELAFGAIDPDGNIYFG